MPGLLIIDDEDHCRQALVEMVSAAGLELSIILLASSGEEGLRLARQHHPELALIDFSLPGLNGLETIRCLLDEQPGVKIVIWCAYDEFPGAQKAIRLGASDYLIKPVRLAAFGEVLRRLCEEIQPLDVQRLTLDGAARRQEETHLMVEARLVEELVHGPLSDPRRAQEALARLGKTLACPRVIVIYVEGFSPFPQEGGRFELYWPFNYCAATARRFAPDPQGCLVGYIGQAGLVMVISSQDELADELEIRDLGEDLRLGLKACAWHYCQHIQAPVLAPPAVTVSIGRAVFSLRALPHSYAEALRAQSYKLFVGSDTVIHIDDVEQQAVASPEYPLALESELLAHVRLGELNACQDLLGKLMDNLLFQANQQPEKTRLRLMELIALISRAAIEAGAPPQAALLVADQQLSALGLLQTQEEIRDWAYASLAMLLARIRVPSQSSRMVEEALEYIEKNKARPNLDIEEVASAVHISASYLNRLFKARLGMTFVKYLTSQRMNEAKRLLRTTRSNNTAVAEAVGYDDVHYFQRVFHRETGITPAAFRRQAQT